MNNGATPCEDVKGSPISHLSMGTQVQPPNAVEVPQLPAMVALRKHILTVPSICGTVDYNQRDAVQESRLHEQAHGQAGMVTTGKYLIKQRNIDENAYVSNTFNINVVNVNVLHTSEIDANVSNIKLNKTESLAYATKPITKNKHISGVTSTSHLSLELPGASPPSTN